MLIITETPTAKLPPKKVDNWDDSDEDEDQDNQDPSDEVIKFEWMILIN